MCIRIRVYFKNLNILKGSIKVKKAYKFAVVGVWRVNYKVKLQIVYK